MSVVENLLKSDEDGPEGPSDRTLLRRFCGGDQQAATDLYLRYAQRLESLAKARSSKALATRVDAEEIVQSVFRTFFRRAYEGQYEIPAGEELWKLFLVISLNKIRKKSAHHHAAKRSVAKTTSADSLGPIIEDRASHNETAFQTLRMIVDDVLGQLPPLHRQMVEMRIEGNHVAEIAERTNRSKRSVERILQRFRTQLRELIDEPDGT